jgi:redox-sensitive bicupin YhaK (pirin superfamily)
VCDRESGSVSVAAGERDCEVLLLGGEPLNEPIARYGPFVMNTREEIIQAFEDYEAGRLGSIVATGPGTNRN